MNDPLLQNVAFGVRSLVNIIFLKGKTLHHLKQSHNVTVSGSLTVLLCEIAVSSNFVSILVHISLCTVAMKKTFEAMNVFVRSKYVCSVVILKYFEMKI